MNIGYPCINRSIDASSCRTFRLASFSEERFLQTVESNLDGLQKILEWNVEQQIFFFRITSDLIPFASHPICTINWQEIFLDKFSEVGKFIQEHNIRVAMHPDQFVLINTPKQQTLESSIRELEYHADVLNLLHTDFSAKIQIHVGGAYGDKETSIATFIERYHQLSDNITQRLVIENDDRIYSAKDCLKISEQTGIPILFDVFHHQILNNGESVSEIFRRITQTWKKEDGVPIVDYSSQEPDSRIGKHTETIDLEGFKQFLEEMRSFEVDVMLEIKDKEKSAAQAITLYREFSN